MSADSWKLSLPCTLAEAQAINDDAAPLAMLDAPPVLMTSEAEPDNPDAWRLDAYFDHEPDADMIARVRALVPSATRERPRIERLGDEDWLTMSQAGLEPVHAGRFFVHTSTHAGQAPAGTRPLLIEAGLAFGTGQHETTTGCLLTLDSLKRRGALFREILDLGTGTGLLAFAAMHLWPRAHATASDIDPISIAVTRENADVNGVKLGTREGQLALVVAPGMAHRTLKRRAPYDLIVANILAGPLIDMAAPIAAALDKGGTLILAGLLDSQADRVAAAYRRQGLRLAGRIDRGDWPTLRMVKRRS
jgi:ribosomal protein L11 methyltransferase